MLPTITLQGVTADNFRDCIALTGNSTRFVDGTQAAWGPAFLVPELPL